MKVLGHAAPVFPYDPPAIVTVPLAFLVARAVSAMDRSGRRAASVQRDRQATGGIRA